MLSNLDVPRPEHLKHPQELKMPLLSYKKSSRAGLWLLAVPFTFALIVFLKYRIGIASSLLDRVERVFVAIADHAVLGAGEKLEQLDRLEADLLGKYVEKFITSSGRA